MHELDGGAHLNGRVKLGVSQAKLNEGVELFELNGGAKLGMR